MFTESVIQRMDNIICTDRKSEYQVDIKKLEKICFNNAVQLTGNTINQVVRGRQFKGNSTMEHK